jgi:hypothetical protein
MAIAPYTNSVKDPISLCLSDLMQSNEETALLRNSLVGPFSRRSFRPDGDFVKLGPEALSPLRSSAILCDAPDDV